MRRRATPTPARDTRIGRFVVLDPLGAGGMAAAIFEDANGPDHIDNAIALEPLAYVYAKKGDLERARVIGERALALRENKLGKDHPSLASLLDNLSDIALRQGRAAEARDYLARSVRIKAGMTAAAGH